MRNRINRWLSNPLAGLKTYFQHQPRLNPLPQSPLLLVQCVEDAYYYGLFGQIICTLRQQQPIRVEQYVLRCLREGEPKSVVTFLASRLFFNPLHNHKWISLYRAFSDGVAFNNTSVQPLNDVVDLYHGWTSWRNLTDMDALIKLKIDQIPVGDLINDSFIRFKPAPKVSLNSPYLWILLWQAYRTVRRAKLYFQQRQPMWFLSSYSTYIQHGIPVRIALQQGVKVYTFGNYQEFAKPLTLTDWVHTKNATLYAEQFAQLPEQDEKLAAAAAAIGHRLSGGVDGATAYMKKSAYAESATPIPDVGGATIIFMHDFFDSPHVYHDTVFPNFWEWVCFTMDTLQAANKKFYLKPHPNQIGQSQTVLDDLKRHYADLPLLPAAVSNVQLVEAGIACAVTVYGTVAHEMAYLGIPTIACARHPHISFSFCQTARNRDEYAELLSQPMDTQMDKAEMRRQSLIFYYMHNLSLADELKTLISAATTYRITSANVDQAAELVPLLQSMAVLPGFQHSVAQLVTVNS